MSLSLTCTVFSVGPVQFCMYVHAMSKGLELAWGLTDSEIKSASQVKLESTSTTLLLLIVAIWQDFDNTVQ